MEQIGSDTTKGNGKDKRKTPGRKDGSGQSSVIDCTKLREDLPKLKKLRDAVKDATEDYNAAKTKSAEKAGLHASVVNKVVEAWSGDDFEEKCRQVEQLSLAFEEAAKA